MADARHLRELAYVTPAQAEVVRLRDALTVECWLAERQHEMLLASLGRQDSRTKEALRRWSRLTCVLDVGRD